MKISRRDFIHAGCAAGAVSLAPHFLSTAQARSPRGSAASSGPTGTAILNGFNSVAPATTGPLSDYPYKNLLLGAQGPQSQSGTMAFPAFLDNNGYPLANPSAFAANIGYGQVPVPPSWTGNYIVGWTGKANFTLDRGAPGYAIVSGGSFVSGGTGFGINAVGTSGRIVFTPTTSSISAIPFIFGTTIAGAFDGSLSGMYLCRDNGTDEADILSGDVSRMFNNDFISAVSTLKPYTIRVMDFCNTNNSMQSQPWTLRRPLTSFSFGATTVGGSGSHYPPSCWAGAITGTTDTFSCAAAPGAPASWTHGETFQAQFGASASSTTFSFSAAANNGSGIIRLVVTGGTASLTTGQPINVIGGFNDNTKGCWNITVVDSTHIDLTTNVKTGQPSVFTTNTTGNFSTATINCGARGAKLLAWGANGGGQALVGAGSVASNAIATFIYDADLDVVLGEVNQVTSGITSGPPIEVVVALANKLNCGLWFTFPTVVAQSATYPEVASIASYVSANLKSTSSAFFEFGNEIWNTIFGQTNLANLKGLNLGLHEPSNEAVYSYYGLRCAQLMPVVKTAWGARAGLHTVLANQAFAVPVSPGTPTPTFRFNGASLTPTGNAVYAASSISGGVNYSVAGNRPIDFCTDVAYATYTSGAQIANADANYSSLAGISGPSNLLGQAANFVAGGATNIANALAFADNDIRQGTLNGVPGGQTLLSLDTNIYPAWESLVASYDAFRLANGLQKIAVSCYEGACEIWPVTAGQLASLGDTNSVVNAANILALIDGYKNSPLFKQYVLDQFNQMMGTFAGSPNFGLLPHSKHPNWYTFGGGSQWALNQGDLYSSRWQSYAAFQQFNGG